MITRYEAVAGRPRALDGSQLQLRRIWAADTLAGMARPSMELVVLGAGPAYSDREDATGASYLVRSADATLLLDLGQGSFPRIFRVVRPENLGAILVSHLHPDHFIDLVPLRHYLRYQLPTRARTRVIGPRDLAKRLDDLHAQPGFASEALDIEPVERGVRRVDSFVVEARQVTHTDESYAFRVAVDDAIGVVYSGDCGRPEDLAPLVRPGDVLLAEASFGPGPVVPGALHLDGPAVAAVASERDASRVLLTHLQMGFDPDETITSVRRTYRGPVELVWPGSRVPIR